MPHATYDEDMADVDEEQAIASFLNPDGASFGGAINQADKSDNAVDYEDISDEDDLPNEEEATNALPDEEEGTDHFSTVPGGFGGLPVQASHSYVNGFYSDRDVKEQHSEDLFGEPGETNDLFGERLSSPEEQHESYSTHHEQPPPRPSGLALPSRPSLALPGLINKYPQTYAQRSRLSPESMSPSSSVEENGYSPEASSESDDPDDFDPNDPVAMQRKLFRNAAKKQRGEEVDVDAAYVDMEQFHSWFPNFDQNQYPNFVELFPPRPAKHRGKLPLKAPRPLQITKLSLDLLPDQEKSFRLPGFTDKSKDTRTVKDGMVYFKERPPEEDDSEEELGWSVYDEDERIGGVTMQDLGVLCGDWDVASLGGSSATDVQELSKWDNDASDGDPRPRKRQMTNLLDRDLSLSLAEPRLSYEQPERATKRLAKTVTLDLNDPNLLLDDSKPQRKRNTVYSTGISSREMRSSKGLATRYNISNDEAYDLLKENHQHKVRSTLGSLAVEHSLPAAKLQYPFYKIALDSKSKRAFHRPHLEIRDGVRKQYRFSRPKHIKRKHLKGKDIKDIFAKAEDLTLGDNSNVLLLEYSEEAPSTMSNFGMGNRLINYYRKRDADDQERPKREVGETHVLLTQDKSPFANFGHVDQGEVVPTIQNGLYRAPVFQHNSRVTDFLVGVSSSHDAGTRFFIRTVDNLHTVGQQFPVAEVPEHSARKVTDAAKKRLRALSYRIYSKSIDPSRPRAKALNNENLMPHLPGHDMPQTRSKMREFMKYDRGPGKEGAGVWVPMPGQVVPDAETLRGWIKPEDVCLLDSMQVGVQRLNDLGLKDTKGANDNNDADDDANIEIKLSPWYTTKNFIGATQGKTMVGLHGDGDPTGRGEGFSLVKISMKGQFRQHGASAQDKIEAKKRRETGGHSYNVAEQQREYDASIRTIWNKQKESLSAEIEPSDTEMDEDMDEHGGTYPYGRAATPRSSIGTPATMGRRDNESASQFSRGSGDRSGQPMIITRHVRDNFGVESPVFEEVTNPRVLALYRRRRAEKKLKGKRFTFPTSRNIFERDTDHGDSVLQMNPTGDDEEDRLMRLHMEQELARVKRNMERREAREKAKGKSPGSLIDAGSPGRSDADAGNSTADGTPHKGRGGRNKDGTQRKCANCGQVGHIKTNRKSVNNPVTTVTFRCLFCDSDVYEDTDGVRRMSSGGRGRKSAATAKTSGSPAAIHGRSFADNSYSKFTL